MKPFSFTEHVAFPGAEVCGYGWPASYAQLHDAIRAGELPARYITWSSEDGGMGDQLLGIASVFIAALLTKRAIILKNPYLETVFEPAEVDWRWHNSSAVPMHDKYKCWRHHCLNETVSRRQGRSVSVSPPLAAECFPFLGGRSHVWLSPAPACSPHQGHHFGTPGALTGQVCFSSTSGAMLPFSWGAPLLWGTHEYGLLVVPPPVGGCFH